jgi:hypothetical protein
MGVAVGGTGVIVMVGKGVSSGSSVGICTVGLLSSQADKNPISKRQIIINGAYFNLVFIPAKLYSLALQLHFIPSYNNSCMFYSHRRG